VATLDYELVELQDKMVGVIGAVNESARNVILEMNSSWLHEVNHGEWLWDILRRAAGLVWSSMYVSRIFGWSVELTSYLVDLDANIWVGSVLFKAVCFVGVVGVWLLRGLLVSSNSESYLSALTFFFFRVLLAYSA
jgi:hypothetical protein